MPDTSPTLDYYHTRPFRMDLGGESFKVISKPGVPHWNGVSPAMVLLADVVELEPDQDALLIGSGHGALAAALGRQLDRGRLFVYDQNYIAQTLTSLTLKENGPLPVQVLSQVPLPEKAGAFDSVLIDLPKGRKLARQRLLQAYCLLKQSGRLFIAGANQEGIQPVIKDAETLLGAAAILGYKKGNRVSCLLKKKEPALWPEWASQPGLAGPEWSREQNLPALPWHEFEVEIRQTRLCFRITPSVFSFDGLDDGTRLLLENLPGVSDGRVLDFGCGCGVIGLFAARWGAEWVDMVDVNVEAVAATCENMQRNQVRNGSVFLSDVLSAVTDCRYDYIFSNPPFHVGSQVDYEVARTFLQHARHLLNPGGKLVLVSNRFIPYDRVLKEVFRQSAVLAQTSKFHVLAGYK